MKIANLNHPFPWKTLPTGERITLLLGRHQKHGGTKHQTIALVELPAGSRSEPHYHKEREESYFFVEGTGVAKIGEREFSVAPNDLVYAKPGESHQFINQGTESMKYLVITSPAWVPEDSFSP